MLGGQDAWTAHAAAVAARVELQQITVEPDWHYSVCTRCGWEVEADRSMRIFFRYSVASHDCSGHQVEISPVPAAPNVSSDVLF
jgi:hypothetical protein